MTSYTIDLADRPAALERLLGIFRRRRFPLVEARVAATEGGWRLDVTFGEGCPPPSRVLPLLARDHDVRAIRPVP